MTGEIVRREPTTLVYLLTTLLAMLLASAADAMPAGFEKFHGEWVGKAIADTGAEIEPRDIRVKIKPQEQGFSVTWVLVIHKAAGKDKRSEFSVSFQPTKRPNIFGSAMRLDVFGNATPLDPLRGEPYVWARVEGITLTIYALVITDVGGYELHTYERTLLRGGMMKLNYHRVVNGEVLRVVTGTLERAR
jgi:hypothetical protein